MKKLNKKAVVMQYLGFLIIMGIIIVITALIAPAGALLSTEMYGAGETIMLQAQDGVSRIQDETVKNAVNESMASALDSTETNILISTATYKYAWIIFAVIAVVSLIVITRSLVEYNQQFGSGGVY